ncbi:PQQ-binding-like beta-propeller repeat protein, partial [Planctomycetota bacterium]
FYNNEEDIVLYKDNIIVSGLNGTISIIKMSKLKPGEWLLKNIDVRPSTRPTAPCILFPKMHQGLTGLFFGGGEKANMVGAVSIEKEKALWGNAGNDTPEGKDGEKKENVLAQNIPGREVKGDVLNTPISMGNSILFSTTQGYIYDIDINTGTIRNHFKVGVGAKKNMIGVKGKNLYFIENSKDVCFIYKVNIDTGKKEWQKEISGNIYEGRPVILNGKIILGFSFSARGRVIAVSEEDGSIVWKYPKKGDISKVTQEIAVYNNMLFCAAGTDIIVLHPEKGTKLFEGYSTELANITEKLLVHDGYIYALTGDGKIYCFMIPASLQTKK